MVRGELFRDKRGDTDLIFPVVIFIVLNVIFFGILLGFVYKSSTGALVYEQSFAKEIALIIDNAKPYSIVSIDFKDAIEVAEKNEITSKDNLVSLKDNKVLIKLSNAGGYSFEYFSDYDINYYFDEDFLIITIDDKSGGVGG